MRRAVVGGVVGAGLFLAAAIVSAGLSDHAGRNGNLPAAMFFPGARGAAAAAALSPDKQNGGVNVEALAIDALHHSLTHVAAIRTLGLAAQQRGDNQRAAKLMSIAGEWGWRDLPTQAWLLHIAVETENHSLAMQRADALLRLSFASSAMFAVLRDAAVDPKSRPALVTELASDPSWRLAFFQDVGATDPKHYDSIDSVIAALDRSAVPVRRAELNPYLLTLINARQYARAYTLWAGLFGDGGGHDDGAILPWPDGGAQIDPSPFDWTLSSSSTIMALVTGEGKGASLSIQAPPEASGLVASRRLLLGQGPHSLRFENPAGVDPSLLRWRLVCDEGGTITMHPSSMGSGAMAVGFLLPPGCMSQYLTLELTDAIGPASGDAVLAAPRIVHANMPQPWAR